MTPLLDIDGLATLLKRSPQTIRRDMRRNPTAVPPRLCIPGTRLLRWREHEVDAWLDDFGSEVAEPNGVARHG